jgi:hypothetical protein
LKQHSPESRRNFIIQTVSAAAALGMAELIPFKPRGGNEQFAETIGGNDEPLNYFSDKNESGLC